MSNPLVSVVIPCYNHEDFVIYCIQSVIDQSYDNIELIIIDDGSEDDSVLKIQKMVEICKQRFVRFEFRSRSNIGLSATLNEALGWCKGKYFSVIASDDLMLKYKTTIQVNFLENHADTVAVFGGIKFIDTNNTQIGERLNKSELYDFKKIIMHKHDLPAPTQLIRLDAIRKVGGYKSEFLIEDWYMWLKLSENNSIFYIDQFLALYRLHENNISKKMTIMHKSRFEILSCFKTSIYYDKALNNIKWLNACDNFTQNKENRWKGFFKFLANNPFRVTLLVLNKLNIIKIKRN